MVTELEPTVYKITMDIKEDQKRTLKGSPWILKKSWLILQEWDGVKSMRIIKFSTQKIGSNY